MKADECLIFTDVDGVYTTDPRVVSEARRLKAITFEEMLELASLGSKVLQTRSVEFAGNYRVPTRVLSSLTDPMLDIEEEANSGTLISFEEDTNMEQAVISGIAFNRDEAKITVLGVPDRPGVAYHILGPVADANIEVDMIIQNQSVDGKTDFTFTVPRNDFQRALDVLNGTKVAGRGQHHRRRQSVEDLGGGRGHARHVGVASQMFRTLSEEGINIMMISTSEIKISVLIDEKYMELAVRALHKAFELEKA
jgi:aspartate kinase